MGDVTHGRRQARGGKRSPAALAEIGIICGMASEARTLAPLTDISKVRVAISGARPDKAESQARRLVAEGCRVLISWGIAGGLDPSLAPGDLLTPGAVIGSSGRRWPLMPDLAGRSATAPILGLDAPVMSVRAKAALAETGAAAVDMETHRLALVGMEADVPVLAIRAVADPASRSLPALAAHALDEAGRPRLLAVALGLLRRPTDLAALLEVRKHTECALAALAATAERIEIRLAEDH